MNTEIKITKLQEQKEWTLWKLQAKVVLRSMEVFCVVDGTEKEPKLQEDANSTEVTQYRKRSHSLDKERCEGAECNCYKYCTTAADAYCQL